MFLYHVIHDSLSQNPLRQSDLPMVSAFLFPLASGLEKDHSEEISSK